MSETRKSKRPPTDSPDHVAELIGRRMGWSRAALWIERTAQAFWPLYAFVAGGLAVALLVPFDALPFWLHVAALAGFAVSAVAMAIRGAARLSPPTDGEAWAKLDAGSPERPATSLLDRLEAGGDDPATRAIWAEHRRRMAEKARRLRPAPPDLRLSSRDRWALRYAAPLSLLGALFLTAEDGRARLDAAFSPSREVEAATGPALSIEAWATPPIYTGAPPVYLTQRSGEEAAIALPEGTRIAIQVFDAGADPSLIESVGDAAAPARFSTEGGRGAAAEITLLRDGAVEVTLGERVAAAWRFSATPDLPPTISFTAEPKADAASLLELSFAAADDFGVAVAAARIEPDAEALSHAPAAQPFVTEPITLDLPLPLTGQATEAGATVSEDLTRHLWAGLPVTAVLTAEDEIGQTGESETARFMLPQRRFYEPMARVLIEQRRSLGWDLARAEYVHAALSAVTVDPEAVFSDHTAYLATRTAIRRLGYALQDGRVAEEAASVLELLWDAAVRIEDGDLSNAAERLRAAQNRLRDAIRENAPDDEIARLMQELREALADFLNQMARQALQNPESLAELPDGADVMDQQSLEDMLNRLEDAARSGMRAQAEQLLSQLQQMLENLQMAQRGQGQGMQGPGQQALRELQDLIGRQQGLADETYRQNQQRGQGQQGEGAQPGEGRQGQDGQGQSGRGARGSGSLAAEQEELRRLLDDLRQGLPRELQEGAGEALGRAGREMGDAQQDLLAEQPGDAVDDQVDAIEAMREGAEQLGEALRQMAAQSGGENGESLDGPGDDAADVDPLGRPTANMGPLYGDSVDVPDGDEVTRSRELLEELRRRAGERRRPREELDYIDRLMEQF